MGEKLNSCRFAVENGKEVVAEFYLHESEEATYRPYGICEVAQIQGGENESVCAAERFATKEEARAIAQMLAEEKVTPVSLRDVI